MKKLVFLISLLILAITVNAEKRLEKIFFLKVGKTMTIYYDGTDSTLLKSNPNDTILLHEKNLLENLISSVRFFAESLSDGLWEATINNSGNNLGCREILLKQIQEVPYYKTLSNDGGIITKGRHYKISECYKDLHEENENLKDDLITTRICAFCLIILLIFSVIWMLRKNSKK